MLINLPGRNTAPLMNYQKDFVPENDRTKTKKRKHFLVILSGRPITKDRYLLSTTYINHPSERYTSRL